MGEIVRNEIVANNIIEGRNLRSGIEAIIFPALFQVWYNPTDFSLNKKPKSQQIEIICTTALFYTM